MLGVGGMDGIGNFGDSGVLFWIVCGCWEWGRFCCVVECCWVFLVVGLG